jgi:hypothetical protein
MAGKVQINDGSVFLNEQAAAQTDITAYGQIWVKDSTPNELWFTDDAGNDVQLGTGSFSSAAAAYMSSNQSISTDTTTKVNFDTEYYDNDSEYDSTTNYRFTATTAGKYHVSAMVYWCSIPAGWFYLYIYKNGANYKYGLWQNVTSSNYYTQSICADISLAATDYVEIYVMQDTGSSQTIGGTSPVSDFSVHRIA